MYVLTGSYAPETCYFLVPFLAIKLYRSPHFLFQEVQWPKSLHTEILIDRVCRTAHGKPGKSWNFMMLFSRPEKSEFRHGSRKVMENLMLIVQYK